MKNRILLIAFFALIATGCSSGSDNSLSDVFIPDISNQWTSSRGTFFFFNTDDGKTNVSEDTFTGNEEGTDADGNSYNHAFAGKYKNYDISFTFTQGDDNGVTYTGKFVKGSSPLKIQVKGTNGVSLTITRQQ